MMMKRITGEGEEDKERRRKGRNRPRRDGGRAWMFFTPTNVETSVRTDDLYVRRGLFMAV